MVSQPSVPDGAVPASTEIAPLVTDEKLVAWRDQEWIETDGLGGFASGTASGIQTRRYHALLLTSLQPPTRRCVLVNGYEAWVATPAGRYSLSSHEYNPDVVYPDGVRHLVSFTTAPWPTWTWQLPDGIRIIQELFVPRGKSATVLRWKLDPASPATASNVTLTVRPFLSCRDYHGLHHENPDFQFTPIANEAGLVSWQPYQDLPAIRAAHNGSYHQHPDWFRNFLYRQERERGLDYSEDLASPGEFQWELNAAPAVWLLTLDSPLGLTQTGPVDERLWAVLAQRESQRRSQFVSNAAWGAEAYLTRRGTGQTIIAGYPWFTDWGRDTFISIRGLCLATGRLTEARQILLAWSKCVSKGMLPNRFPDSGRVPEYNSVDAALWFIVAVHEFLELASATNLLSDADEQDLLHAVEEILRGYHSGTRFGIHCDSDGLLSAGQEGVALTWMDARVGEWTVTPRIGKPVEIQALWINALRIGELLVDFRSQDWRVSQARFIEKFWLEDAGHLADVADNGHQAGEVDASLRPNQLLAVGGLPFPLLEGDRARRLVATVQTQLLTPLGLRTLSPQDPNYRGQLVGDMRERDAAYHQGTVWPWLLGPFVESWLRVHGDSVENRQAARQQFLAPLLAALPGAEQGPLHIPEIVDGNSPHTSRGCPFQAWSLGEYLRLDLSVLG